MDIKEVKRRRDLLEEELLRLVDEFETETDTSIYSINVERIPIARMGELHSTYPLLGGINLEIKL